jgi:2-polyprenyl-6-methoxyphenol hydroxylase-like FAD-dependent oxidoreductase
VARGYRVRIVCVGAGPAGLYFAVLMKQRSPRHEITVLERNAAGSAYGWGITFWDDLVDMLQRNAPELAKVIIDNTSRWLVQRVDIQGKPPMRTYGDGYTINRQDLLDILTERARELGVRVEFERSVMSPAELPEADLIVACDGVNSRLRELHSERFGTKFHVGRNRYVWLGTDKVFDEFTFAFVQTDFGWIWGTGYGIDDHSSTFVVECPPTVWTGLGLDVMPADDSLAALGKLFECQLDGYRLMGKHRSDAGLPWRNFSSLTNEHWHAGKVVLMGDAAHATHFTIGCGTTAAMKDAAVLAEEIQRHEDIRSAAEAYEKERKTELVLMQSGARFSAQWFENISRYIDLEPDQFSTLLFERRSPLLARLSPLLYLKLYRAMEGTAVLREFRKRVAPVATAAYSRRKFGR